MFCTSEPALLRAATCDRPGSGTNTEALVLGTLKAEMDVGAEPVDSVLWLISLEIRRVGLEAENSLKPPALLMT